MQRKTLTGMIYSGQRGTYYVYVSRMSHYNHIGVGFLALLDLMEFGQC